MKKLTIFLLFISSLLFSQSANIHHELNVKVFPAKSSIEVTDIITINKVLLTEGISFLLNQKLPAHSISKNVTLKMLKNLIKDKDIGMDRENDESGNVLLTKYVISYPESTADDLNFKIEYKGKIDSPIEQSAENYQRGFSESPGIIDSLGVYLAGSTYWTPHFGDELVNFNLTVQIPKNWKSVSVGKRTLEKSDSSIHIDKWESPTPQEEIFLIAAKFTEYTNPIGAVTAMAFLRTPDEALANKYLETTAQYMEMYRQLIGPYPYSKFALVENFWETGYGMPSFTLLGEKIIRFPFILHSSYPHELLHNWWGNSVYVDFKKGNWCEGLTAYMADHLIKEQRGQGENYRKSTLQRFTNYVNDKNDFPINKFISRYDGPSEAIGYGKTLMMWHMLRRMVGDEEFIKSFQIFNRNFKFKYASFDDIRKTFETETGKDLDWFFDQWINKTGAPVLALDNVQVNRIRDFYHVSFNINQKQDGYKFTLDIPVTLVTKSSSTTEIFRLTGNEKFSFNSKDKPLKLLVDPQYDVFRRLDPGEIPSSFSSAFGKEETIIILPDKSNKNYPVYKTFAINWITGKEEKFTLINSNEVDHLPNDKAVLILGFHNKFTHVVNDAIDKYSSSFTTDSVKYQNKMIAKKNNSFFIAVKNPDNHKQVILLLAVGNKDAVPGLVRKLPHYGKYSYLAFEGSEPSNIAKGQWPAVNSPLIAELDSAAANIIPKLEVRKALAELTPVFSSKRMIDHIKFLSDDKMEGRGLFTAGIKKAKQYIVAKFEEYNLKPGADDGSYFQSWNYNFKDKGIANLKNIIGIIPGSNPDLVNYPVVISAHYDHLGYGWPDVRKGNEGKIHNGADDNASGIAVLLELAKILGNSFKPERTIIFAAFTAEEEGLLGSKYFVNNYQKFPVKNILANLNLDTVGRLFGNKLMIINSNTAKEWKFIFMGTEYTTGISTDLITQDLDASDQMSFIEKGIPAVQFFSGPNSDYHRPTDTADKIDPDGLVKTATVSREVLVYLGDRDTPMNFTGKKINKLKTSDKIDSKNSTRRVSTGSMPDFTYSGKGIKISAVGEGSPAADAGLHKGDIIVTFDGNPVNSLKDYSDLLKQHKPGDIVEIGYLRDGKQESTKLKLAER